MKNYQSLLTYHILFFHCIALVALQSKRLGKLCCFILFFVDQMARCCKTGNNPLHNVVYATILSVLMIKESVPLKENGSSIQCSKLKVSKEKVVHQIRLRSTSLLQVSFSKTKYWQIKKNSVISQAATAVNIKEDVIVLNPRQHQSSGPIGEEN